MNVQSYSAKETNSERDATSSGYVTSFILISICFDPKVCRITDTQISISFNQELDQEIDLEKCKMYLFIFINLILGFELID